MIKRLKKREKISDHILTFLLIANSGFPFFTNNPYLWIPFSLSLSFLFLFHYKQIKRVENKYFWLTVFILAGLLLGQIYAFKIFDLKTSITLFLRWVYPFITLAYLRDKFPIIFTKHIYVLSIISFLFFIPSIIIPGFESILYNISEFFRQQSKTSFYNYNPNIIIYTIKTSGGMFDVYRNSGPFWEAGGFGVYLNLALILNTIREGSLINKYNIVYIIAIFSTVSTAALLSLFVFIFLYQIVITKKVRSAIIYAPLIIIFSYYLFTSEDIFRTKIERQINTLENINNIESMRRNRMVSALVDLKDLKKSPIFGLGRSSITRYGSEKKTYLEHRNNGLTDFLLKYGIPFFLFYFYFIHKGLRLLCFINNKNYRLAKVALIVIMLEGFSQAIFQQSVFLGMYFFYIVISKKDLVDSKYKTNKSILSLS